MLRTLLLAFRTWHFVPLQRLTEASAKGLTTTSYLYPIK